jgi:6-phosphogluconolactonase (cycloisomerase 2 family)
MTISSTSTLLSPTIFFRLACRLRSWHACLIGALGILLVSHSAALAIAPLPSVYVAERLDKAIGIWQPDSQGRLVKKGSVNAPLFPFSVKLSKSGRFLFALTEGSTTEWSHLWSFTANPADGQLTPQAKLDIAVPTALASSPGKEKIVYFGSSGVCPGTPCAYEGLSWVSVDDNGQMKLRGTKYAGVTHPVDIALDSASNCLYVAGQFSNALARHRIDRATGAPSLLGTTLTGKEPKALTVVTTAAGDQVLYEAHKNEITGYLINTATCGLTPRVRVPSGFDIVSLRATPNSKVLVAADDVLDKLYVYQMTTTGGLVGPQIITVDHDPEVIVPDASGRYIYITHYLPRLLSTYEVKDTGQLSHVATTNDGGGPQDIASAPKITVPALCPAGRTPTYLFRDTLENLNSGNWTTNVLAGGFNHWVRCQGVPDIYCMGFATSGSHELWGWATALGADSVVEMRRDNTIPSADVRMQFNIAYA